jgi:hypothetical protein
VEIPSRNLNPMSSQSIVLTGGGGKTILIDFEEEGSNSGIKKGKDKGRGGEECLVRGVVSKTVFIFVRLRSDIGGEWDLAAAGTAGVPSEPSCLGRSIGPPLPSYWTVDPLPVALYNFNARTRRGFNDPRAGFVVIARQTSLSLLTH